MNDNNTIEPISSEEFDLLKIINLVWNKRKLIFKVTIIFFFLGLTVAFVSPKEYNTEARMLPEVKSNIGGASALLKQFSSLGGFSLPADGSDAISPLLYPDVLKSTSFYKELLENQIYLKKENQIYTLTVFEYFSEKLNNSFFGIIKKYTIYLPWTVLNWFRDDDQSENLYYIPGYKQIPQFSKEQFDIIKALKERISSEIDQKTGIISISAEFPDPFISAQIADFSIAYLSQYITQYRIEKATADLNFIKERLNEKEREYFRAQQELAQFTDANKNVILALTKVEEQRLNNQFLLAFNVYNGLAQQYEQARITVQEQTPVIKILEPVQIPVEKDKPKRSLILIGFTFFGIFLGICLVIAQSLWQKIEFIFN